MDVSMRDSTRELTDRIAAWARDHPEATEYCLGDETEARQLLLVIVATMKQTVRGCSDMSTGEKNQIHEIAVAMRKAAAQAKAMDYIRELNATDQLEFLGLEITTPAIVLM